MTDDTADVLLAVAQALAGTTDPREIARRAAREVTRLLGADTSVYFQIDDDYEYAVAVAGYRVPEPLLRPDLARIRIGDLPVFIGDALGRHETAATAGDHPFFDHPFIRSLPVRPQSLLYAPVVEDARLKGALVSYWWSETHRMTERDIRLATSVARQAAITLAAARVVEQSEQRRREAEAAEPRYRSLFERSLAGVFRTRRDGRISECNPAFARILGHARPDELIGRPATEFWMQPADRDLMLAAVEHAGAVTNVEVTLKRGDGQPVAVLMNVATVVDAGERVFEGQILDITDRKRAEAARREADALRSVASLANGAAHDINNPLTVIRGVLELLVHRSEEKVSLQRLAPALRAVEQIAETIRRMSHITRLELVPDAPGDMTMLDIRESAPDATQASAPPDSPAPPDRPA